MEVMEVKKMYWTTNEVRTKIFSNNISKTTLLSLIDKKEIPAIRFGHKWYIPAWWVDEQIKKAQGPVAAGDFA